MTYQVPLVRQRPSVTSLGGKPVKILWRLRRGAARVMMATEDRHRRSWECGRLVMLCAGGGGDLSLRAPVVKESWG